MSCKFVKLRAINLMSSGMCVLDLGIGDLACGVQFYGCLGASAFYMLHISIDPLTAKSLA